MLGNTWELSYAAIVSWKKTEQITVQQKHNKIQRLVLVMVTRCMKSTPNIALENLIDLPPLHL